jgi:cytochrome c biogenesis protein CcmG, thiol:disulfide interchange protein DsbE
MPATGQRAASPGAPEPHAAAAAADDRGRRSGSPLRFSVPAIVITAALALVALLAYGVIAQSPSTNIDDRLARGQAITAPGFELAVLQPGALGPLSGPQLAAALRSGRLGPRQLRGIPFVVNFWASWCDPCRQEAALLERTWQRDARPRAVLFLGVDQQDATTDATGFLHSYRIDYLNVRDPGDEVARSYGATGVPETFFIDRRGRVVGHVIGVSDADQLRAGIAAALTGQVVGARRGGPERPSR